MTKYIFTILLSLLYTVITFAQVGGNSTYEFLRLSTSARITALGGSAITIKDADPNIGLHNPAALNSSMHKSLAFNQSVHPAGISYGTLNYTHHINQSKVPLTVHGGLQYINYGSFLRTDEYENTYDEAKASEYAIHLGAAYQMGERLSFGVNLKSILSYLDRYNSQGMALDLATMYYDSSKNVSITFVLKNLGSQFTTYNRDKNFESLPFDVQLGVAHRLKHLPMRFSFIFHQLNRWNVLYDDPNAIQEQTLFNEDEAPKENKAIKVVDNIFRHVIFNMEFLFGKKENFRVALGYNHMRRGELAVKTGMNLSGFSFGLGIKIKQFRFDYGFGSYHLAGSAHHFGLSVNIDEFKKG